MHCHLTTFCSACIFKITHLCMVTCRISGKSSRLWTYYYYYYHFNSWVRITQSTDFVYVIKFPTTCKQNASWQTTQDNETLFPNWQKESWQTSEETSRYVRPERVNKWPNSMTDTWWWWLNFLASTSYTVCNYVCDVFAYQVSLT